MPFHVSADEFERIAGEALNSIPEPLRARMDADNLMITVRSDTGGGDADEEGVDQHVLGYFEGGGESTFSAFGYPKRIVLMQQHIERWCRTRAELVAQVTDTVLHEVAHYFGMSHDDMRTTRLRR
ncbi:MAG: metallopeptidase family protein [Chloroflexi bacterium]|nr:MAG: metallopeptidase family protein [Chloroflexota bacterium]